MLKRLHVKNYVLIDSLDIEFPEGLVIITGQTGAGKSILLGSIALALGGKADISMIGEAGDSCVVEAEFETSSPSVEKILEDNDVECDGGVLILRRVIGKTGRSRAFANDCPVPASVLSSLSAELIDIHSQHQTLLLADRRFQLSALDHYAKDDVPLAECAAAYKEYTEKKTELENLDTRIARIAGERDYDMARYSQLDSASLQEGELEALESEQKQLANAEEIKENLCAVESMFTSDDASSGQMSVDAILRETERRLEKVAQYVPSVRPALERVASARVELDDILSDISDLNSRTELSESRLAAVEERLSLIYGLLQKFSCRDEAELIAVRDSLKSALHDSSALEERRAELAEEVSVAKQKLDTAAAMLHEAREKAAPAFAAVIQESIRFLELQYAVFDVELGEAPVSQSGKDSVLFRFSSTGKNPVDISKCASGGEMSRIMLCLKEMMARYTNMPTMIFDEIDTGVSGSVADKMGGMICRMGDNMQVFAITHLPQVAAKGKAHYVVSKETDPDSGKAVTTIHKLSQQERLMEVARMLSGSSVTDAAIANARSLLSEK